MADALHLLQMSRAPVSHDERERHVTAASAFDGWRAHRFINLGAHECPAVLRVAHERVDTARAHPHIEASHSRASGHAVVDGLGRE